MKLSHSAVAFVFETTFPSQIDLDLTAIAMEILSLKRAFQNSMTQGGSPKGHPKMPNLLHLGDIFSCRLYRLQAQVLGVSLQIQ